MKEIYINDEIFIKNWDEVKKLYYSWDYWNYIVIQFNKWDKYKLFKKEWWEAIKFNWIDEFYNSCSYWDYIKIEFNEWDKYKLFKKEWWQTIKFNWIDEFYNSSDCWDYIEIQFNKWDELQKFYYKDLEKETITLELNKEHYEILKPLIDNLKLFNN